MYFDYTNLKILIRSKYASYSDFAEVMGMTTSKLERKLNGRTSLSVDELVEMAEILKISPEDIGKYFFTLDVAKTQQDRKGAYGKNFY